MRKTGSVTIELGGHELRCSWEYTPATPDVMYLPNGDPGYPGDPDEFNVTKAELAAHLITPTGNKIAERWLDVTDLLAECADEERIHEVAREACEDDGLLEDEPDDEPEDEL